MSQPAEKFPTIGGVPAEHVPRVWPGVEPLLKRVVRPDTGYTLDSVLHALLRSEMQLWVIGAMQGVAVTQIENRPAQRVLFTLFLAGDHMKDWLDDWIEVQDAYALHNECAAIEFNGRKGWNKLAATRPEWKSVRTVFRREFK